MIYKEENFGEALRRLRTARGMSVRQLAELARISKTKIGVMEHGDGRNVDPRDAEQLDLVLESGITLATAVRRARTTALSIATCALLTGPNRYTDLARILLTAEIESSGDDAVERRTFLHAGLILPALTLEATRHGIGAAMTHRDEVSVDEWQEIVSEHGQNYMTMPPHDLLEVLMIDMVAIQYAATRVRDAAGVRDLQRASAMLAALTAFTVSNLGRLREARRWWRTARTLADESTDPVARNWVRGSEVVRALYEQRPVDSVVTMAGRYEQELGDLTRVATPTLLGGKAEALALAGRAQEADSSLIELEEACANLPKAAGAQGASALEWHDFSLGFTRSYVHSFNGNYPEAEKAQDAAIALYPAGLTRGPATIRLQRALCVAEVGAAAEAARDARAILESLPAADHIRPIVGLSHQVLNAIPASAGSLPEVREYREFLAAPRQIG
ncbi:helix-turn-helix transcriptional regulator [Actinoplanes sp. NPDC023714]|uniref:helix-turn-helix domain-containing protein n=1 Tax=Actinoplanes sp. NPDC023714 TaxID=3154322 RepID=UPI0033CCFE09